MFRKCTLLLLASASALQIASAQSSVDSVVTVQTNDNDMYRVETNLFRHNWFAGLGVGAQIYFGDHDRQMNLADRISPYANVYVGKWFTPGIGVRLGVGGGRVKGLSGWTGHNAYSNPNENVGNYQGFIKDYQPLPGGGFTADEYEAVKHAYPLYQTQMDYLHAYGDVLFNVSQMVFGYKSQRTYSFIPYASVGFAHSLDKAPRSGKYSHEFTAGLGILNRIRLSDAFDLNADIRATFMGDHFDQEDVHYSHGRRANSAGRYAEGVLSVSVGVSYNFGKRDWGRSTTTTIRVNENTLADLRGRVGQLQDANNDLRRQLENALNREITQETVAAQPLLVTFPINKWVLSNKDRVNLGFLAKVIKDNPKLVYSVTGYADRGTGSVKRNIFLARKRSEVIYECLVKEFGVSESQLRRDDKGGVENMYYDDPRCSRAVLVKVSE